MRTSKNVLERNKKYYLKNKQRLLDYNKEYRTTRKDYMKNHNLEKKYSIGLEFYKQMLRVQKDSCAICKTYVRGKTAHVDHCHKFKRVRKILCSNCNTAIGLLKDNKDVILAAYCYVNFHHALFAETDQQELNKKLWGNQD